MNRRLEFDGIRCLACLGIILYHAKIVFARGCWLGVDVFFVLSGYLITSLLLAERSRNGSVSLRWFWTRRFARLYPALLLTVVGYAAMSVVVKVSVDPWHASAVSIAYLSDLMPGNLGALGHTWSLSVEEQFYLLWPLFVVACRGRRRRVLAVSLAGLAASFALLLVMTRPHNGANGVTLTYCWPHTRAWELLAGCALACVPAGKARWLGSVGAVGVVGVMVAVAVLDPEQTGLALGAQCGSATLATVVMLRGFTAGPSVASRLLSWPPLVWLGVRSYGLYLFHHPIVGAVFALLPGRPVVDVAAVVSLTIAASWFSYRFVETPVRAAVRRWQERGVAVAVVASSVADPTPELAAAVVVQRGATEGARAEVVR